MIEVPEQPTADLREPLEALRKQYLAAVREIRPKLHRFCTRMTGSALDGEDRVQEALAQGFYRLDSLDDERRLEAWLFRIAHRKCVDFLRAERRQREDTVPYEAQEQQEVGTEADLDDRPAGETLLPLVSKLPPKERAAVLLKDLLDYELSEVAEVIDSTVGGVKAALHRGRTKLRALAQLPPASELDRRQRALLDAYVECFNRRDWDSLRQLISADARLEVVGAFDGKFRDRPYLANYAAQPWEWKLSVASVDGELVVVQSRKTGQAWRPTTAIRLWWEGDQVVRIRDYVHVDYVLEAARLEAP